MRKYTPGVYVIYPLGVLGSHGLAAKENAMRTPDQPSDLIDAGSERKPWTTLILLGLAQFMVILDITVVNVALPSIGEDLDFPEGDLQWVITAYVLFTGGLLMLGGRATDLFGRRRVFLAGLTIFTLASLASGLAPSPEALIAARAAQGSARRCSRRARFRS